VSFSRGFAEKCDGKGDEKGVEGFVYLAKS